MPKTDKELTTEIVCEFLRAWGTQSNCVPIKIDTLPCVIEIVYNSIHSLDNSEK